MRQPVTCLWLDDEAESAAQHYADVFGAQVVFITHYRGARSSEVTGRPEGSVLTVDLDIHGHRIQLLNGGPAFQQSEAASIRVPCEDQAELDRIWQALLDGGGRESMCGWITDSFGVSWQITPARMDAWMHDGSPEQAAAVLTAVLDMRKLDVAMLEEAFERAHAPA